MPCLVRGTECDVGTHGGRLAQSSARTRCAEEDIFLDMAVSIVNILGNAQGSGVDAGDLRLLSVPQLQGSKCA